MDLVNILFTFIPLLIKAFDIFNSELKNITNIKFLNIVTHVNFPVNNHLLIC